MPERTDRAPASASWRTCVALGLVMLVMLALGCEPSVSARAVWVDAIAAADDPVVHVYDRGERRELPLQLEAGQTIRAMILDPSGRGLLVRVGDQRAAWIDLHDGRRFPILLPPAELVGSSVEFAADGSALIWRYADAVAQAGELHVLPLAPGLPLARDDRGGVAPLVRAGEPRWLVGARAAPIALVAEHDGRIGLWRWPDDPSDAMQLRELAGELRSGVPSLAHTPSSCSYPNASDLCVTRVGLDPSGELAIFADDEGLAWQRFDLRAPDQAELALPSALIEGGDIGLVQVLDRAHSVWLDDGVLHWWDHAGDQLRSLPVLGNPPYRVIAVERGHALVFVAANGPILRADREGLRPVSLTTTPCSNAGTTIASPRGGWIAWTCFDADTEFTVGQGVVVRVSALGLERYVGVPMTPLAIDDHGDLLLHSVQSVADDTIDGVDAQDSPRSLFVLSREGVLTRVDELEPQPAAVSVGSSEFGAYLQAAAL